MQLPRGTFRSIRKGVTLGEILHDLTSSGFTGISTLSSLSISGTLVFRNGGCILAEIQDLKGDRAWDAIIAQAEQVADTALSDLTTTQLQLALDFNQNSRVTSIRSFDQKPSYEPVRPPVPPINGTKEHRLNVSSIPSSPVIRVERQSPAAPDLVSHTMPSAETQDNFYKQIPADEEKDTCEFDTVDLSPDLDNKFRKESENLLKQLDLEHLAKKRMPPPENDLPPEKDHPEIDPMEMGSDIEDVTRKIRKDYKIMLKQLDLDHLTEE